MKINLINALSLCLSQLSCLCVHEYLKLMLLSFSRERKREKQNLKGHQGSFCRFRIEFVNSLEGKRKNWNGMR